jgi:hypothetical protein
MYGYQIIKEMEDRSQGYFKFKKVHYILPCTGWRKAD